MTAKVELSLTGSLDQLRIVWQTGEALLESIPFVEDAEGTRYNFLVSVQEMVTNVLRHAYQGDEDRPIEVTFEFDETGFSAELRDQGPEFDPLNYDTDDLATGDSIPEQVGGYGIMIVRTIMDSVHYQRRDGWNCLRMKKLVDSSVCVPNG